MYLENTEYVERVSIHIQAAKEEMIISEGGGDINIL